MGITIRDVARRAGVSISTVSRVLNNTCPVNEDKRRRVEEAARVLGYTPNPAARSLLKRETGGLGVLLPYVGGEFFSELLGGVDRVAQQNGFFLLISTSHRNEAELKAALQGMYRRVDGLLVMAPEMRGGGVRHLVRGSAPMVFVNTEVEDPHLNVLNFDNYGGVYALVKHLLAKGHRRIAYIRGPEGAFDARERLRGYREALREAGLPDTARFEMPGDYSQEAGYAMTLELLARDPRPTAIVGCNDYCAVGVLHALHEAGLRVPEDVALAGFDDVPSARYTQPPLTSVHVPVREMGEAAMHYLIEQVRGEKNGGPRQQVFPVTLVPRASTDHVRGA